jgi:membrane protein YdbS with pleckstrin-like domain
MSHELQTLAWIVGGVVAVFLVVGLMSLLAMLIPAKYRRRTVSYNISPRRYQHSDTIQAERDLRHIRHLQDMECSKNLFKKD